MNLQRISFVRAFALIMIGAMMFFSFGGASFCAEFISPKTTGSEIIFENDYISYVIGKDGLNKSFSDKKTGRDYIDNNLKSRFMSIDIGKGYIGASEVVYRKDELFISFGNTGIVIRVRVRILPEYITFTVVSVNNLGVREIQLASLPLTNAQYMGNSLANTRDDVFAGCVVPLNMETSTRAKRNIIEEKLTDLPPGISVDVAKIAKRQKISSNSLTAMCESRVKLEGAAIAIIGCPPDMLLGIIEQVEIESNLPHPTIGGVWTKKSKEVRESYLFTDYGEATIDEVIDYARTGGFGYVMIYDGDWTNSLGTYLINKGNFPGGEEGLKKAVAKIHAAGMKAGVHSLDRVISKSDPLVHPVPHPGLLKRWENERILAKDLQSFETFIPTA